MAERSELRSTYLAGCPCLAECLPPAIARKIRNDRRLSNAEREAAERVLRRLLADIRRRRPLLPPEEPFA
jgi:hypothetical protein